MRLAASNIAWTAENDATVYEEMQKLGFTGVEIAPTRIFPEIPYGKEHRSAAKAFEQRLRDGYGLSVLSLQSIWYGKKERLFGSEDEREALLDYTRQAIAFAATLSCPNLVLGSPQNRIRGGERIDIAYRFFRELGDYAAEHGTILSIEPNPAIYETDFLTRTEEAISFVKKVGTRGLAVNLDMGTMVANEETAALLRGNVQYIHHVHLSEPFLKPIVPRMLHRDVVTMLQQEGYGGAVSLEAKCFEKLDGLFENLKYLRDCFGALPGA